MTLLLEDPSSPELALVDPQLAARLREAPTCARISTRPVLELEVVPLAAPRGPVASTVSKVLAGALVSVLVLGLGAIGRGGPGSVARPAANTSGVRQASATTAPTVSPADVRDDIAMEEEARAVDVAVRGDTTARPRPDDETAPVGVAAEGTELTWLDGAAGATYEVRVVRDGAIVYVGRTDGAILDLPSTWSHRGRIMQTRPEDEVYVWRVVNGRRTGRPIVDGQLALDMTRVVRAGG